MGDLPKHARAVVVGGGIAGCSTAYHLAKLGWDGVVLLERKKLTCGTTWHAAGLLPRFRPSKSMTRLAAYSHELYAGLEIETGVATGYKQTGALTVATAKPRMEELRRAVSAAKAFDAPAEEVTADDAARLYPGLNIDDVVGGAWFEKDAQGDPVNITLALAKGAKQMGAQIVEDVAVEEVLIKNGRVVGVRTEQGDIAAEYVVNAAGMWARELGQRAGVAVPLHACEHFYIVSEPIDGLPANMPSLRVPDEHAYYKADAGKILLGAFEPCAKPWGMDGIPKDFCFDSLPEDYDHFAPVLDMATARLPLLQTTGVQTFFNGPESFTPDNRYLLGEAPEVENFYVIAGFNSVGIQSAGGAGMALAQWMNDRAPPMDLWETDICRFLPWQAGRQYLRERVAESLGVLYADHFPHRQMETARGLRCSPIHDRLSARGACFGETAGWERPHWFLPESELRAGKTPKYEYGWGRQNWFVYHAAEHAAVRESAGFFDLGSFGKIRVRGADAEKVLQHVAANNVSVACGRIVYTPFLNSNGGVEADVTIVRLAEDDFLVVSPAASVRRDIKWLRRHISPDVKCELFDMTGAESVLAVFGPESREFLSPLTGGGLDNDSFPFATAKAVEIDGVMARAHRISFAGELGWEIYTPTETTAHVFDALMTRANDKPLTLCGMHALDSCRLEKGFRHFGHELSSEDHVLEAGLGFAVKTDVKEFVGRDAVLRAREKGLSRRLMLFQLQSPEPLLFHHEPVWRDGKITGYITGGNYGHTVGAAVGFGYVSCAPDENEKDMLASRYEVEVAGEKIPASASFRPLHDSSGARMRT